MAGNIKGRGQPNRPILPNKSLSPLMTAVLVQAESLAQICRETQGTDIAYGVVERVVDWESERDSCTLRPKAHFSAVSQC